MIRLTNQRPTFLLAAGMASALAFGASSAASAAVTAPFSEDFDDGAAPDFSNFRYRSETASTWTLTGGAYHHESETPGTGQQQFATAVVQANNLDAPSNFLIHVTAHVTDVSSTSTNSIAKIGLIGLAKNANGGQWNNDSLYYAGEVVVGGSDANQAVGDLHIRRGRGNNSAQTLVTDISVPSFSIDDPIEMTLAGIYDTDGNLELTFTVSQTSGTITTSASISTVIAAADVYTGKYFGIRDYTDNNRNLAVTYDNFTLSNVVPEPASLALIGLGGLLAMKRRQPLRG